MNRTVNSLRITAAAGLASVVLITGGVAQAHAAIPAPISSAASSAVNSAIPTLQAGAWNWVCKHLGWGIGPQGCR